MILILILILIPAAIVIGGVLLARRGDRAWASVLFALAAVLILWLGINLSAGIAADCDRRNLYDDPDTEGWCHFHLGVTVIANDVGLLPDSKVIEGGGLPR